MSTIQWVSVYLCVAALVAGAAVAFAVWSRGAERITAVPALLAGALWPLLLLGAVQWLLVHGLAKALRPQPERTSEAVYYGPPSASRHKVNAG